MTHSYVCCDSVICVTCLIHMRDLVVVQECGDEHVERALIHVCHMCNNTDSNVTHAALIHTWCNNTYVTHVQQHVQQRFIHTWHNNTDLYVTHQHLFVCVTLLIHTFWHDGFLCVWRLSHMCVTTQSYVCHILFTCVNLFYFSWWVLQHCTGFARLVWGRLRVHRAFVYSDWFVCYVCDDSVICAPYPIRVNHSCRCMGWLRLVGSFKKQVSFAEYSLFHRALLQKRPVILRSLLIVATPYQYVAMGAPPK